MVLLNGETLKSTIKDLKSTGMTLEIKKIMNGNKDLDLINEGFQIVLEVQEKKYRFGVFGNKYTKEQIGIIEAITKNQDISLDDERIIDIEDESTEEESNAEEDK